MPVKIRLQRHGKKGKPFYWIVAADARSKRDGKYLEKLGTYDPNKNPAIIELDLDGTVKWLNNGAQPTDTARAILSYKGVMLKRHLAGGVKKGAFTEEEAEKKFQAWLDEKAAKVDAKVDDLAKAKSAASSKSLETEKAVNEARTAPVVVEEEVAEEAETSTEEVAATEETAEIVSEETKTEEDVEEAEATTEEVTVKEETTEIISEETKTEETVEEVKASNEEE
ncbi:30S ribosomal protein S16 [Flavobacteriaceae bacterium AH-315-B10]|nr:30S ribosomal protein S16 [Flavobacteriaceae bacterium AH-315-B10]